MSVSYASGKNALGLCDRCGKTCRYRDLRYQVVNQQNTRLKVCTDCLDVDQPQLQVGRYAIVDPQALIEPRPDTSIGGIETTNSRWLFSWDPVGANIFPARASVGQVTAQGE